jgi:hypothetical protein
LRGIIDHVWTIGELLDATLANAESVIDVGEHGRSCA